MSRVRFKGYSSFIKKTEGKKDVSSGNCQWDIEDLRNVEIYSISKLRLARVEGEGYHLVESFCWKTTPQGSDYWIKRYKGTQPLTQEDKQFLKELYIYHGYNARPHGNSSEQSPPF